MLDEIKKMAMAGVTTLMSSPVVAKVLASEKTGVVIEKAMTVPFKISNAVTARKEKIVQMFDLATQEDVDELRRAVIRVEDVLRDIKKESGKLLEKMAEKSKS
jgi:hypothetical protein